MPTGMPTRTPLVRTCQLASRGFYGYCGNKQILVGIHFATECHFLCGRCEFSTKPAGFVSGWPCQLAYSGIVWTHPNANETESIRYVRFYRYFTVQSPCGISVQVLSISQPTAFVGVANREISLVVLKLPPLDSYAKFHTCKVL